MSGFVYDVFCIVLIFSVIKIAFAYGVHLSDWQIDSTFALEFITKQVPCLITNLQTLFTRMKRVILCMQICINNKFCRTSDVGKE